MLTGKLPFQGRTQQEMMIARLRSDPVPLRKMRPELDFPESVERVLNKAMQRNPDDRYQTRDRIRRRVRGGRRGATGGRRARVDCSANCSAGDDDARRLRSGAGPVRCRRGRRVARRAGAQQDRPVSSGVRRRRTTRSRSICRTPARRFTRTRRSRVTKHGARRHARARPARSHGEQRDGRRARGEVRAHGRRRSRFRCRRSAARSDVSALRSTTAARSPTD